MSRTWKNLTLFSLSLPTYLIKTIHTVVLTVSSKDDEQLTEHPVLKINLLLANLWELETFPSFYLNKGRVLIPKTLTDNLIS